MIKEQIKLNFRELGISDRLVTFDDGKGVVDYIDNMLGNFILDVPDFT